MGYSLANDVIPQIRQARGSQRFVNEKRALGLWKQGGGIVGCYARGETAGQDCDICPGKYQYPTHGFLWTGSFKLVNLPLGYGAVCLHRCL